jgi:hypothetical protein
MKTLVIHPSDSSTDFLSVIYSDKPDWKIIKDDVPKLNILEKIILHDRIIMLGHGTADGLLGFGRYVIDKSFARLLRSRECVCIWCNADVFVNNYGLNGFYTGMIISELEEAMYCGVEADLKDIEESNKLFASSIKNSFDSEIVKSVYKSNTNEVIMYNNQRIYGKLN